MPLPIFAETFFTRVKRPHCLELEEEDMLAYSILRQSSALHS